jgi:hypothetical protein
MKNEEECKAEGIDAQRNQTVSIYFTCKSHEGERKRTKESFLGNRVYCVPYDFFLSLSDSDLCFQLTRKKYTRPISFPQISCTEGHIKSPRGPFAANAAAFAVLASAVAVALAAVAAAAALVAAGLCGCC